MKLAATSPLLIIFSGLPGTGKSTLARNLSAELRAVCLRIDSIEWAMAASVLKIQQAEDAGYRAAYALAEDNLRIGHNVVADSVNPIALSRREWHVVAKRAGAAAIDVEVICSDIAEHKFRVEARRTPGLEHHPTWSRVRGRNYEPWAEERIVVDTAGCDEEQSLQELLSALR